MEMPLSAVLGGSRKPRRASPRIRLGRLGREPGLTHAKAPIKLCSGPRTRCLPFCKREKPGEFPGVRCSRAMPASASG